MNICSFSPSASNVTKKFQFDKGLQKIWDVWCKGVRCSVMGELKKFKVSSLRSLIDAFGIERSSVIPYLVHPSGLK